MAATDQLALLERDIDATRERLALHRRLLAEQLAPHGAGPDLIDELLTACDEWGAAQVREQLAQGPERFGLTALLPARLAMVGPLIEQLANDAIDFDDLVGAREAILTQADPAHRRVYPWFGRELVLDANARTLRFADAPGSIEPMTVVTVPNRVPPTREPDAERARQRRPDRDR